MASSVAGLESGGAHPVTAVAAEPGRPVRVAAPDHGRWTRAELVLAAAIAAVLLFTAFAGGGGGALTGATWVQLVLVLLGTGLAVTAILRPRGGERLWGAGTLAAVSALAALTALSIAWSLAPADGWLEANLTFAYLAVVAGGLALVRLVPEGWRAVLLAVAGTAVLLSLASLVAKSFPEAFGATERFARLGEPFGYWNAVGLMAVLGVPPLLWLGARREGRPALTALAVPAVCLLLVTVLLSYSRGALLALGAALSVWFVFVPLRLRGAAVLLLGGAGAVGLAGWAFSQSALSSDGVPLDARADAGIHLFALLVVTLAAAYAAGLLALFARDRRAAVPDEVRRRLGRGLVAGASVLLVAGLVTVAASSGGVRSAVTGLTAAEAPTPGNSPGRLTATASVRSRYWREAVELWQQRPVTGLGAGSFKTARNRVRTGRLDVQHAHGYVPQVLADLGLLGLAVSLAGLGGWAVAARRSTGLGRRALSESFSAERAGLVTMVAVVVGFLLHAAIDWTWSVPGTAVTALLCAAWVAGRGPGATAARGPVPLRGEVLEPQTADGEQERRPREREPVASANGWAGAARALRAWRSYPRRAPLAVYVAVLGMAVAWAVVQPLRSADRVDAAVEALADGRVDSARSLADDAAAINPLSIDPWFALAAIEDRAGRSDRAEAALERAAAIMPASPEVWRRLGRYRLVRLRRPAEAVAPFSFAVYLDPGSLEHISDLLDARRQAGL